MLFASMSNLLGQKNDKQQSQAEEFSNRAGVLIESEFINIGVVSEVIVQVVHHKDLIQNTKKSALYFEYVYKTSIVSLVKKAYLDVDEIEGLIKSIKNIQTNALTKLPESYTEVTFKSKTGFKAGAYFKPNVGKWMGFVKLNDYDDNSFTTMFAKDLQLLLELLEKAKIKLQ